MKILKFVTFALFFLTMILPIYSQDNLVIPKRTPEQEAAKQTEMLQQELDLNQVQVNKVYKINLYYARERQISNKRSEALERMKNKNADIKQILSPEQNERLQSKRYERTYYETNNLYRNQTINSSGLKSSSNLQSNSTNRIPASTGRNVRTNLRPVNPNFRTRTQSSQNTRRVTTSFPSTNQLEHNPTSTRSSGSFPNATRRNESGISPNNNSTNSRTERAPAFTPGRNQTPLNTNRK